MLQVTCAAAERAVVTFKWDLFSLPWCHGFTVLISLLQGTIRHTTIHGGNIAVKLVTHQGGQDKLWESHGSILRYAESLRQFTEIKQVSTCTIQALLGFNAWNTFVLRVEHLYIVRRSDAIDMARHQRLWNFVCCILCVLLSHASWSCVHSYWLHFGHNVWCSEKRHALVTTYGNSFHPVPVGSPPLHHTELLERDTSLSHNCVRWDSRHC